MQSPKDEGIYIKIVAAFFTIALVAYFFQFWSLPAGGPASWGQFGDYMGGLINPVVGIATVSLVVNTLRTSRKEAINTRKQMRKQIKHLEQQLEDSRRREQLEEKKKRLDGVLADWNIEMGLSVGNISRLVQGAAERFHTNNSMDVRSFLSQAHILESFSNVIDTSSFARVSNDWKNRFAICLDLLREFSKYFDHYENNYDNRDITDYYRRRIQAPIRVFRAAGLIAENELSNLKIGGPLF